MAARTLITAVLLCSLGVLGTGCQSQRMREAFIVDAFSAETRLLEDRIYELEYRIDDLESRGIEQPRSAEPMSRPVGPANGGGDVTPGAGDGMPDLTPPDVVPGTPTKPDTLPSPSLPRTAPSGGESEHAAPSGTSIGSTEPPPLPEDTRIERVVLADATRSADFDQAPGDDGIWVAVQPLNPSGQFVPIGGPVTVVLLDAASRTHVGRWEFDAASADQAAGSRNETDALFLRIDWEKRPSSPNLHLFVRYEAEDGRRFEVDRPITVRLEDSIAERWTPRSNASGSDATPRVARGRATEGGVETTRPTSPPPSALPQGPPADVYR
ncbi:MAG: hypothetical protein FJ297_12785 [Planctomycetes bacterium]|nr:hypothetical protein [Planctomycetota bacterium]